MLNNATIAALLLICAGILHNYSFMCRKLKPEQLKVFYPSAPTARLAFDMGWMLMAAMGIYLTFSLSMVLAAIATAIYFLLFPFILQPPLARLLGFKNLREYVDYVEKQE